MPSLFWSGKLSLPMRLVIEANNLLALFTGSYRDSLGMKERVKKGYEGAYTDHIKHYDELGYHLQDKSARFQLDGMQLHGMQVLDVGCGTGALAQVAYDHGSKRVVCGDISAFMLMQAKHKELARNMDTTFCQLDAEGLPFKDNAFDGVISGMAFGLLPDQKLATTEMARVVKPGGLVCIGAHGPEHYWEAIDATLWCTDKRYVLGYRFEWWPRKENYIRKLLVIAGLECVQSKRIVWRNIFESGAAAYNFFAAISSSWWYVKYPPEKRVKESMKTRDYFNRKNINMITDDIVVAYGYKPGV